MSRTTPATAAGTILAIDLGKYKSVAYLYFGDHAAARHGAVQLDLGTLIKYLACWHDYKTA